MNKIRYIVGCVALILLLAGCKDTSKSDTSVTEVSSLTASNAVTATTDVSGVDTVTVTTSIDKVIDDTVTVTTSIDKVVDDTVTVTTTKDKVIDDTVTVTTTIDKVVDDTVTVTTTEEPVVTTTTQIAPIANYNPYVILLNRKEKLSDGAYDTYTKVIDAIESGAVQVQLSDYSDFLAAESALNASYPPYALMATRQYDKETNLLTINYRFASDVHSVKMTEWRKMISDIVTEAKAISITEVELAKQLYTYVATNIDYDHDCKDAAKLTAYRALTEGYGVCYNFAGSLEYLYGQVGIECIDVMGTVTWNEAHRWLVAKIDGEYYHLDPTFESSTRNGIGYKYFGMSDELRQVDLKPDYYTMVTATEKADVPLCNNILK